MCVCYLLFCLFVFVNMKKSLRTFVLTKCQTQCSSRRELLLQPPGASHLTCVHVSLTCIIYLHLSPAHHRVERKPHRYLYCELCIYTLTTVTLNIQTFTGVKQLMVDVGGNSEQVSPGESLCCCSDVISPAEGAPTSHMTPAQVLLLDVS